VSAPSYHDLHLATPEIERTSIFNLPCGLMVQCSRVAGWQLWETASDVRDWRLLAGEYAGPDKWLVLDAGGTVIVNSRDREDPPEEKSQ
jgi:hypothetical protein